MPPGASVRPYRWLAQYYDELFEPLRFPIDAARERVLGKIIPLVHAACDLACGTGSTALLLARQGIAMYAVDLSPDMCRLARRKARSAGLPIHVIHADMQSFRLPETVDLVTCEYDALNHLPRKEDLGKVARSVARSLKPGGHFYFDVNNSLGFERYWTSALWLEKPAVVAVMRNSHSSDAARAWSDVEWFVREGKLWRRHHEHVEEVCWDAAEIRDTLRQAGFDRVRAWDGAPFFNTPLIGPGCRTVYLAHKAGR